MTMTPEVRSEFMVLLRQELDRQEQQKRENRSAYRRVFKEFESEMSRYDYETSRELRDFEGNVHTTTDPHPMRWKLRDAIGTLLRAVYQADSTAKLPAAKEPEMREFTRSVLDLMERYSGRAETKQIREG